MSEASEVLAKAKKQYKAAVEGWREIYAAAKDDLDFMSDAPGAMWDSREYNSRAMVNRPVPQIDQLTQFKHQVVNDIRMNTPTINVIPADLNSDMETATILSGRIKAIEYKSNADSAYDMAADFSVGCSIGFIRVDRHYVDDDSFEQELCIKRVVNPLGIYIDPNSTEPDGSDAKYAFVIEEMSLDDFKRQWPDAEPVPFEDTMENGTQTASTTERISIVEYFCIDEEPVEYGLLPDGTKEPVKAKGKYKSTRKMKKRTIRHYKLAGQDILEETTFPGKYIPLVPVYGEEAWNGGKRHIFSLIRKAKDAQRTFNLWKALETELLLKQQQAPVQAAAGQMRGFEDQWENPDKAMVLYYNQTDIEGNQAPAPQRLQPPTIPTGIVNASQSTANNIREILGMYNAAAGKREGNASGIALRQLDQSSDVGNFHFGDNLIKSITHVGKILVCALPEVEDTSRIVPVVDKEENFKMIGINGAIAPEQERPYNFDTGKFDVRVTTGPSFTTQRQEAATLYQETLKILPPEAAMNVLDLVFKYQDSPGAEAMASRLKKMVNPQLLDEKDREKGEENPQVAALSQQLQQITMQAQQQIQALQAELQSKQAEYQVKMAELEIKAEEVKIKHDDVKLKMITALQPQVKESAPAQPLPMSVADEPIEVLQARIIQKAQQEEMQRAKEAEEAAMEAQKEQREFEQEQQELQLKMADMQARDMQARALINGISGIQQTLGVLVQTVQAPAQISYDDQGRLIEVR